MSHSIITCMHQIGLNIFLKHLHCIPEIQNINQSQNLVLLFTNLVFETLPEVQGFFWIYKKAQINQTMLVQHAVIYQTLIVILPTCYHLRWSIIKYTVVYLCWSVSLDINSSAWMHRRCSDLDWTFMPGSLHGLAGIQGRGPSLRLGAM